MGEGQRMPLGRPALPADSIALIAQWIDQGASFDGPDPRQDLRQVRDLARAESATHDALSAERVDLAKSNWQLGMPGIVAAQVESPNFFVMGNVSQDVLEQLAEEAESMVPQIASLLGVPSDKPLLKGRLTLYLFAQRYDYGEFGRMVEQRDLPRTWSGHWQYNVVDAYGAMIVPRDDHDKVQATMCRLIAGSYLGSFEGVPRWFAEGTARVVATRVASRDRSGALWDQQLPRVLAGLDNPTDFLNGRLPQEDADLASYGFAKLLMSDARRFRRLVAELQKGRSFDQTFRAAYGRDPKELATTWLKGPSPKRKRGR
jgi:hypothetical protein